ncbi:hypothetical protein AURDEDRAFT_123960 [Auricularia subglabra TFB-10046 SS5]|nr:hypothetical protein AURDEDRAFT_123960 [Auricularia subglabra TFB-10046 SS5]
MTVSEQAPPFHWVRGDGDHSPLIAWLDREMANSQASSAGFAFEDVMLFLFWDWFGDEGRPLNEILDFLSPVPKWAGQNARLISVFRTNAGDGDTQFVDKLHTTEITYAADSAEDTLDWFSGFFGFDRDTTAPCRCPILKPNNKFGGDIVLGLLLESGIELMIVIQCKLWNKLKYTEEIELALWKISPEGFFQGKPNPDLKKKLDAVMENFKAEKDFAPRPKPGKPTADDIRYKGFPPKYRVVRVLAAFRDMLSVPDGIFGTQAIGCYPFAMLAPGAMQKGGSHFSSFRRAVERAEAAEQAEKAAKEAEEQAEAARVQAQIEEDATRGLRRSDRNKKTKGPSAR